MIVKDLKKIIEGKYRITYEDDLHWFFLLFYDIVRYQLKLNEEEIEKLRDSFSQDPVINTIDLSDLLRECIHKVEILFFNKPKLDIDVSTYFDNFEVDALTESDTEQCICLWVQSWN